ncbi:S-layer homology domain-containing protein [Acidaminobacter hydrogenoformans]|uniref:S-layer homology domain-containing protein n=1 Tax=Acidaminobacter hydrogenoformans DSM 2784 TaxID=1120920 RepID=A0A1G5S4T8_9FIRM|nr:S-layer homology domain-containing protein [Acidaminobacter hydrogenoformans]SCZ81375.1 S-layer homology domain-containing protein [Acidaminobacter hydrogenoformans DSM 2784]
MNLRYTAKRPIFYFLLSLMLCAGMISTANFSSYAEFSNSYATKEELRSNSTDYRLVTFTDVLEDTWYKDAVDFLTARGIVAGVGNERFDPEAPIKRADFVILMIHAFGIVPGIGETESFADAENAYYTPYLDVARQLDLISGAGENRFEPEAAITREDMLVMLEKTMTFAKWEIPEKYNYNIQNFLDADTISDYAKTQFQRFINAGWLAGYDRQLMPQKSMTRAEAAQLIYNIQK